MGKASRGGNGSLDPGDSLLPSLQNSMDSMRRQHRDSEWEGGEFSFIYLFLFSKIFIGVQLYYNVVLVSTVQRSESAICIHISPLFWISFPFRSPKSTKQSSLCYTVGSHQLSILYILVYICQSQSPSSSHPPFPPWCPYVCSLHLCLYFCLSNRFMCTIFLDSTYTC